MKKIILIAAVVLVAALATAGFVYAQTPTPTGPGQVPGWMQTMHNQMMGGGFAGMSVMHNAMTQALADKLSISVDELNQQLNSGQTMWQIAESKGWTQEQFQTWMVETHKATLNQLVADGKLTQAQADWMNSHMSQMIANGYGYGNSQGAGGCPGMGSGSTSTNTSNWAGGMMRGYRNNQGGMMGGWNQKSSND